ncbi:DUF3298 and DUF4163 domain-containing protein [Galbibacter sp. BG1]|uniref:DUF3298 and DUF4163 domain-containing protein n=1 Tax=Galbibacter sp. BG1 TaxID=1170699 RepID=UPI0015BB2629|nr:DUF3298 and DUF4163 domain-containing protein [Galbibacter sp. BG1]QLE01355.1 DUF3298 and DUF4163 domain-containing protein [Galbibacter sp. BG1]
MKQFFTLLLGILFLFISCDSEETLSFVNKDIPTENCTDCPKNCTDCPKVTIQIPQAEPAVEAASKINGTIEKFVINTLNYSEEKTSDSITTALSIFRSDYTQLKERFPEDIIPWEASIKGKVSFENENFASVKMDSYVFTGGAHGYGSVSYLNFNLQTGEELSAKDLLIDEKSFIDFAEKTFRKQEKISPEANINSSGFMFENDNFHLPNSIGFNENGIILTYNPYEIAAYADGLTKISIPFEEAKSFIKPKWLEVKQ